MVAEDGGVGPGGRGSAASPFPDHVQGPCRDPGAFPRLLPPAHRDPSPGLTAPQVLGHRDLSGCRSGWSPRCGNARSAPSACPARVRTHVPSVGSVRPRELWIQRRGVRGKTRLSLMKTRPGLPALGPSRRGVVPGDVVCKALCPPPPAAHTLVLGSTLRPSTSDTGPAKAGLSQLPIQGPIAALSCMSPRPPMAIHIQVHK